MEDSQTLKLEVLPASAKMTIAKLCGRFTKILKLEVLPASVKMTVGKPLRKIHGGIKLAVLPSSAKLFRRFTDIIYKFGSIAGRTTDSLNWKVCQHRRNETKTNNIYNKTNNIYNKTNNIYNKTNNIYNKTNNKETNNKKKKQQQQQQQSNIDYRRNFLFLS